MITNRYCELSKLSEAQVEMLMALMGYSAFFDFNPEESLIGFGHSGTMGTWEQDESHIAITFMQMVVLLAAEVEGI